MYIRKKTQVLKKIIHAEVPKRAIHRMSTGGSRQKGHAVGDVTKGLPSSFYTVCRFNRDRECSKAPSAG